MTIQIRKAEKSDIPQMMQLVHELALYENAPNEVTVNEKHFEEMGFGTNPVWWAFVAENKDEKIIGMALYYIRYSTWKGTTLYLEDIIVTNSERRKNIGTRLMDAIIKEAKTKGYSRISWQVLDWNQSAIEFYKKYNTSFDNEWVNCSINISNVSN